REGEIGRAVLLDRDQGELVADADAGNDVVVSRVLTDGEDDGIDVVRYVQDVLTPENGHFQFPGVLRRSKSLFQFLRQEVVITTALAALGNPALQACDVENPPVSPAALPDAAL